MSRKHLLASCFSACRQVLFFVPGQGKKIVACKEMMVECAKDWIMLEWNEGIIRGKFRSCLQRGEINDEKTD